ncbi:MAG: hypothetical protein IPL65_04150 [Lewinellaceae bacterium]|nr:hypothetical protein [Lewinellaceae bacterium]
MIKKFFTPVLFILLFCSQLQAQQLKVDLGCNFGSSLLMHQTRFEATKLWYLWDYDRQLFEKHGLDYTWDDFEADHELRKSFIQPRLGFSAVITYGKLPFFALVEYMSSPSSFRKMTMGGTIGVGQDFYLPTKVDYVGFKGGYKFVRDFGYGSQTIANSIGDKELRSNIAVFFNPSDPLGAPIGKLFVFQGGYGHFFGEEQHISAGLEFFGDLDLTPLTERESRMTNFGVQCFIRFRLMGGPSVWNGDIYAPYRVKS